MRSQSSIVLAIAELPSSMLLDSFNGLNFAALFFPSLPPSLPPSLMLLGDLSRFSPRFDGFFQGKHLIHFLANKMQDF